MTVRYVERGQPMAQAVQKRGPLLAAPVVQGGRGTGSGPSGVRAVAMITALVTGASGLGEGCA